MLAPADNQPQIHESTSVVTETFQTRVYWMWLRSPSPTSIDTFFIFVFQGEAEQVDIVCVIRPFLNFRFYGIVHALFIRVSLAQQPRLSLRLSRAINYLASRNCLSSSSHAMPTLRCISNIIGDSASRISTGNGISIGNGYNNRANVVNSHSTYHDCIIAPPEDRKREILEWLSSLESQGGQQDKRHQDVRRRRQTQGDWRLGSQNRRIFKVPGLRGWICELYSVLLQGPGSRKDISKVGINKSGEGSSIANKNISS